MAKQPSWSTNPPGLNDTPNNLLQPETAPAKFDRRTLRNTGRTLQYNVRVSAEFQDEIDSILTRDRLTRWQWLAVALEAYKALPDAEREKLIRKVTVSDAAMQQFPNR